MAHRVLLLENDKSLALTFHHILQMNGYNPTVLCDYKSAVDTLSVNSFDVIVTDIVLDDGNTGINLLNFIRDRGDEVPVVVITGFPSLDTATEAVRLGAFDYLTKPIDKSKLVSVVKRAVENYEALKETKAGDVNLKRIFNNVSEGILAVDTNINILKVNDYALELCPLLQKGNLKSFPQNRDQCEGKLIGALKKTIDDVQSLSFFMEECSHKKGLGQIVSVKTSPLFDERSTMIGAIALLSNESKVKDVKQCRNKRGFHAIQGCSSSIAKTIELIRTAALVKSKVLITGESGTGKDLAAKAIHMESPWSDEPFNKIDCATLPQNVSDFEMMGLSESKILTRFSDSTDDIQKIGTVFFDTISDLSVPLQCRLLRIIQDKTVVCSDDFSKKIKVDFRIIAATGNNLQEMVNEGSFRAELFYRLRVIQIDMPPLRARREDVEFLALRFAQLFAKEFKKPINRISSDVSKCLHSYSWPGNIGELKSVMEHACVVCRNDVITVADLPDFLHNDTVFCENEDCSSRISSQKIRAVLDRCDGNKSMAAKILGINRRTIYRKIREGGSGV